MNIESITNNYLYCGLWSETDDHQEPLDKNYSMSDISEDARKEATKDVQDFVESVMILMPNIDPAKPWFTSVRTNIPIPNYYFILRI